MLLMAPVKSLAGGSSGLQAAESVTCKTFGLQARLYTNGYSIFDSALYRNLDAEWHFPQEKVTLHDLQMSTSESKML